MMESKMHEASGKMIVKFFLLITKSPGICPNRPILPIKKTKPPMMIKDTPKTISILPSSGMLKKLLLQSAVGFNIQMFVDILADQTTSFCSFQKTYFK